MLRGPRERAGRQAGPLRAAALLPLTVCAPSRPGLHSSSCSQDIPTPEFHFRVKPGHRGRTELRSRALPSRRKRWLPGEPEGPEIIQHVQKSATLPPRAGHPLCENPRQQAEGRRPDEAAPSTSQEARGKPSTCRSAATHTRFLTRNESAETPKRQCQRPRLPGFCSLPHFVHRVRYLQEGTQRRKPCSNFSFSSFPGRNTRISGKGVPAIHKRHSSSRD